MSEKRLNELDGLRGIAAIFVLLFHYTFQYDKVYGHSFNIPELFQIGKYGVHLFFVISGFVIFWTIMKVEKPIDFVWSRFSRLYPVFWSGVVITFVITSLFPLPGREVGLGQFFANFIMFHEYLRIPHVDGVYWTLTIELAFYFWIFFLFAIGQIRKIEKILIVWVLFATILTYPDFGFHIDGRIKKLFLLDYIELFALGVGFFKYKDNSVSIWTWILYISTLIAVFVGYEFSVAMGLLSLYIVFFLVIRRKAKLLQNDVLVYLGAISYPLYLIHQNIGYVIIKQFYVYALSPLAGIVTALMVSIALAHFLMKYIERPSLTYLRNLYKTNSRIQWVANNTIMWARK
jgi:peptidoglycan/LPS O-acetylase OafA/YrhL